MKRSLTTVLLAATVLFALAFLTASSARHRNDNCVEDCQKRNREEVKLCNTLYPPDSRSADHKACLDKAKTKFDSCIAACQ